MATQPSLEAGDKPLRPGLRLLQPAEAKPVKVEMVKQSNQVIGTREITADGHWVTTIGTKRVFTQNLGW